MLGNLSIRQNLRVNAGATVFQVGARARRFARSVLSPAAESRRARSKADGAVAEGPDARGGPRAAELGAMTENEIRKLQKARFV